MSIWIETIDLKRIQQRSANTLLERVGIVFCEIGDDFLKATMPVNEKTRQPLGILHGGASCVLAESVGSTAANYCVDQNENYCVGLDINTNHIRSIRSGLVIATASPFHLGKSTQVWNIAIKDEEDRLISINRLTMAVLRKQK